MKIDPKFLAACVMMAGMVLYMDLTYAYKPLHEKNTTLESEVKTLTRKLAETEQRATQLTQLRRELETLQEEVITLERQLPRTAELPTLIRQITRNAQSYGVVINSLTPKGTQAKGTYTELLYSVSMTGSFHSLGRLFTEMGRNERLFAIRNAVFTPGAASDPARNLGVTYTLVAYTYNG